MNSQGTWISKIAVLTLDVLVIFLCFAGKSVAGWMFGIFPECVFFENGFLCPACGATRCVNSIMKGEFLIAFKFNPVIFLFVLYLAALVLAINLRCFCKIPEMNKLYKACTSHWIIIGFAAGFALMGILRNFG